MFVSVEAEIVIDVDIFWRKFLVCGPTTVLTASLGLSLLLQTEQDETNQSVHIGRRAHKCTINGYKNMQSSKTCVPSLPRLSDLESEAPKIDPQSLCRSKSLRFLRYTDYKWPNSDCCLKPPLTSGVYFMTLLWAIIIPDGPVETTPLVVDNNRSFLDAQGGCEVLRLYKAGIPEILIHPRLSNLSPRCCYGAVRSI